MSVQISPSFTSYPTDNSLESNDHTRNDRPKRGRMRFTPEQVQVLERKFQEQHYLLPADRRILALALRMSERQVKTWFQNKRAQYKRTRPLIRNPIYNNFRSPLAVQAAPFYSSSFAHFSLRELSGLSMYYYPYHTAHVPFNESS